MTRPHFKALCGSTALWLAFSGIAVADVSAVEVWENWKIYSESFGQTITVGSETTSGGTLSLGDVNITMAMPEGKVSGTIDLIEFRERSDGTVAITMSPDYPISVSMNPPEGEELDIGMIFSQVGMSMIASGGDGKISYDFLASEMSFIIDKFFVGGKELEADIRFSMTDLDGKYSITEGDIRQISSEMTAAAINMNVDFVEPKNDGHFVFTGKIEDITSQSSGKVPNEMDIEDPTWMFNSDFAINGGLTTGAATYKVNVTDENGPFSMAGGSATSSLDFNLGDGQLAYGGTTTDTEYRLSGAKIPLPEVVLSMAETGFELKMPMRKSETPSNFGLLTKLVGVSVSDDIWGMLDPGQVLPRDPATLIIDISGTMNWLVDITNPDAMLDVEDSEKMPAELYDLAINDVTLAIAGAEVNGTGSFTFDNTDLKTFDGIPAPTGSIDLSIMGVNGLMDRLIQMGLLPQEQAMGARMMLGLFARPADGPDALSSRIEVKGDGSVFANGQQLK